MSAIECARAILKHIQDVDVATTLVAIAGAESGWRADAVGDCGPRYADRPQCNGCTSFGAWQINTIHQDFLRRETGSSDPCVWANWLFNIDNNAWAAANLYWGPKGLKNWTVYNTGAYRAFLDQARAAVNEALQAQLSPPVVYGSHYCVNEETVSVSLSWDPVPNATRYEVWHADEKLADTRDTHFETQIYSPHWKDGAEYTLAVKACNDTACSEPAEYKIVATCGKVPVAWPIAAALLALLFGGAGVGLIAFAHKEKLEKLWSAVGTIVTRWFR